ncbi:MAG TPA: PQQ-dependent sugar dehydrogenase [Cellvibrionaceae bacterium]
MLRGSLFTVTVLLAALMATPALAASKINSEQGAFTVETVAEGLKSPWGLVFLSDGQMLVTEKPGTLRIIQADGTLGAPLEGLPEIAARGQGGLLDVTLDPDFANNKLVYFSFSEPGEGGSSTAVARGVLNDDRLDNVEVIFSQKPKVRSNGHFGSRLIFANDGALFVTLGDRQQDFNIAYPQKLDNHIGKVVRINSDGSVPEDNPYVGKDGLDEIWSYGHRNIQGAVLHPQTGELWTNEHGPQGGDEINIARATLNYGWPIITYGEQYGGGKIGIGTHKEGMEQPLYHWVPSIATAGMTFYTGDAFPDWKGNLFVTGLRGQVLSRLVVEGEQVKHEERLLTDAVGKRLRHVVQGPDGFLYLLTDESNGEILRLKPAR